VTATPPHTHPESSPTVTLTPAGQVSCTVTDEAPTITATVTQDEAGSSGEDFYVSEYDATGTFYARIIISIPGPLTLGSVVTAEGTAGASLASCQVTPCRARATRRHQRLSPADLLVL